MFGCFYRGLHTFFMLEWAINCFLLHTCILCFMCVSLHPCISALCLHVAVNGLGISEVRCSHNKACSPQKKKHLSPEPRDVDTEDRGVFECQTKKAQGPGAKERKKKLRRKGGINDKYLCLLFQTWDKKKKVFPCGAWNAELCLGPVATSQQAAVAPALRSVSLTLSLSFWCFLPRPPVQSKVGSLFMCKFALRPYEGGAHAESLLSGL